MRRGERWLKVGDICRYVGSGLKMLKGLNQLRIKAIEAKMATVTGKQMVCYVTILSSRFIANIIVNLTSWAPVVYFGLF